MTSRDLGPSTRRRWLRELGELFARIDDACARGDYESARTSSVEVVQLLALTRPLASPDAFGDGDSPAAEERTNDPAPTSSQPRT